MSNSSFQKVPRYFQSLILLGAIIYPFANSDAAKFSNEVERDFPIRSIGRLQLTNVKGDISVQSWAMDKIRIKITKEAFAETSDKANTLFEGIDYRYSSSAGGIEFSSQYGKNLSIEERVQQKLNPKVRMDLAVLAPAYLNLKIWSAGGRVFIKNWNGFTDIRANDGLLQVEGMNAEKLTIQCTSCNADLKDIHSSIRYLGGGGKVSLERAKGKTIYVETSSGAQILSHIQGNQLYVSKNGPIAGKFLKGKVEFHSQDAAIHLQEVSGFLSGTADTGSVTASIRDWDASDQALIETIRGHISILFPADLSVDADIWSVGGVTVLDYPLVPSQELQKVGVLRSEPLNHRVGRIGEGGELLRVFSEHGDVSVLKRKF